MTKPHAARYPAPPRHRRGWVASATLALALAVIFPAAGSAASPNRSAPVPLDCPTANQPYSSRSMLADLVRDQRAWAIVKRDAPGLLRDFPSAFAVTLPPGFARMVTPRYLLERAPDRDRTLIRLDRDLGRLALTRTMRLARCEGYDTTAPALPPARRPALLVFDKITGFRDQLSVDAAQSALAAIAARNGWQLMRSDNAAIFNPASLSRFDAVIWNNVSGDALTLSQRRSFRRWMERGGGFVGLHGSGGDPVYFWPWYADTLIGARFVGHPDKPQFQTARIVVADPAATITASLGKAWSMTDEWYSFRASPRASGAHVLLTLDERSYRPVGWRQEDLSMGDHPIAWTRCVGNGRSFYSAIGHLSETYADARYAQFLENGVAWAMRRGASECLEGMEVRRAPR